MPLATTATVGGEFSATASDMGVLTLTFASRSLFLRDESSSSSEGEGGFAFPVSSNKVVIRSEVYVAASCSFRSEDVLLIHVTQFVSILNFVCTS